MKILQKPPKIKELLIKDAFKVIKKPFIKNFINKCNSKYVHWDKLRYKKIPKNIKPEIIWSFLKIFRNSQSKSFKFNGWDFKYIIIEDVQRILHQLDKGTIENIETMNDSGKERYIISSLMEEAIASSQLEGAATTRKVAKELLKKNKKPNNYSEQMIINGFKTIQKVVKLKDKKISPKLIIDLQREITKDTLKNNEDSGKLRDNNEIVVGDTLEIEKIYHQPPDYKKVPKLIEEFCDFANDDSFFIHPIIKAIILHFLIGYIHPFNDGNGRTARSIFYWYVLSKDYWIFEYLAVSRIILKSKTKYALAYLYTETDENDLTYFINYNLKTIEQALIDMKVHLAQKQKEQKEAMKLMNENLNLRQAEILKEFLNSPNKIFSINEIKISYNVAYDTARNDLLHLVELGKIKKIVEGNRFLFRLA